MTKQVITGMTQEEQNAIEKVRAVLWKIKHKQPVFFNIVQYENLGLVRAFGVDSKNRTNWVLTEKGKRIIAPSV